MSNSLEPNPSPLLRLPAEIRLIIYEHLLHPTTTPSSTHSPNVRNLIASDHLSYEFTASPFDAFDARTLWIRTTDPFIQPTGPQRSTLRTKYSIRSGRFRAATVQSTYKVLRSPDTWHLAFTIPSLMLLNRQIHAEAAKVLYSYYTFSFSTAIEAIVPFLSDLTPLSRRYVRSVELTKRALPYTKEFDRCEWDTATEYLASPSSGLQRFSHLVLNVVAGKPGPEGWDGVALISKADFEISGMAREGRGRDWLGLDLQWVEQLMRIKGLKDVDVNAVVEHCPPPVSETMAFWVGFSRSVEEGFREWVRSVMCES